MKTRLIRIGNSRGIRIPKALLAQTGLTDEVELEVDGDRLVLRPARQPREGWKEALLAMAARGDDVLLDGDIDTSSESEEEWEW